MHLVLLGNFIRGSLQGRFILREGLPFRRCGQSATMARGCRTIASLLLGLDDRTGEKGADGPSFGGSSPDQFKGFGR